MQMIKKSFIALALVIGGCATGHKAIPPNIPQFTNDMNDMQGWKLIQDVSQTQSIKIDKIELVPYINKGQYRIFCEGVYHHSKGIDANLGQKQAEYLLTHQDNIPKEFRGYELFFAGTLWEKAHGTLKLHFIPTLIWTGSKWVLVFTEFFTNLCDDNGRLLVVHQ